MHRALALSLTLVVIGCGPDTAKPANSDPNNQTENNFAPNVVAANVGNAETNNATSEPPPSLQAVVEGFAEGAALASDFAGGLQGDGDQLAREAGGTDLPNERVRDGVENGVSGNSVVQDGGCVTYLWGEGLNVTITFDNCVAEQTQEVINGTLEATITLRPVTFSLVLTALEVGPSTFDGTLDLVFGDAGGLSTNLEFETSEGTTTLVLNSLSVQIPEGGGVTLDGSGSVTTATTTTFDADQVTVVQGDCWPSSGTLTFEDGGNPVTAKFLPTTPTNGTVEVTWPPLISQPTELDVLPPCGTM